MPTRAEHLDGAAAGLGAAHALVQADRFDDLRSPR